VILSMGHNMNSKRKLEILNHVRLVLSDVDGVLTDGGMYYSEKGEEFKKFNTRDGMAVELLHKSGIKTALISRENSRIITKRASKIKADKAYLGIQKKELEIMKICNRFHIDPTNIVYIGDDLNDLEIMKMVGFSATPYDGNLEIKKIANYICKARGGEGVLREVADLIIKEKNKNEENKSAR